MANPDPIIATLAELRRENGLSQCEVARRLGFAANAVCQWESGVRQPNLATIRRYLALFGCELTTTKREEPTCEA